MHYLACVCFSAGLTSGFSGSNHQTKSKTVDNIFIHNNRDYVAQKCTAILQNYWHKIIYLRFHEELGHVGVWQESHLPQRLTLKNEAGFQSFTFLAPVDTISKAQFLVL